MDHFATLKRRTTDLVESIPKNLPTAPKMPNLPNFSTLPSLPSLPSLTSLKPGARSMKGTWQHISIPSLPRSSHSLDVVAGTAYIFGGEVEPRKTVDNDMHIITLPFSSAPADYYKVPAKASSKTQLAVIPESVAEEASLTTPTEQEKEPLTDVPLSSPELTKDASSSDKGKGKEAAVVDEVPSPRLGHATAVIGSRIFLFGGRSAAAETLNENGRVWIFETKTSSWSYLTPAPGSPVPRPRSYFAAVATDKPREFDIKPVKRTQSWKEWAEGDSAEVGIPQRPIAGSVAATAVDEEDAGFGTFIIHGGCLEDGSRTGDLWAFDVRSRFWKQLPTAPGAPRGGASLALAKSRLYRFGGYDGEGEIGGRLDVLELGVDQFNDAVSKGEVSLVARGDWISLVPHIPTSADSAAGAPPAASEPWPAARSVAGMELVLGGGGREHLVLLMGEASPSADGHEGAGRFWGDAWAFQVPPLGMTPASFADAVLLAVGRRTGEGKWTKLDTHAYDEDEVADVRGPGPRGWFATAPMGDLEEGGIMLFGGVNEANQRLGDGWILRLE
ncbi:hypothetical protein BX600DRAFT_235997 [Xylariales sp. PMI_506]|nr:hypothetical protein BX600DRAFT_235997 [Xylariales sp. PMI_506]